MAKDFHCSIPCKRVPKHGICSLFSWSPYYFKDFVLTVVLFYAGSHRYSSFTWTNVGCVQRRLWHIWEDPGGTTKKSTEGLWIKWEDQSPYAGILLIVVICVSLIIYVAPPDSIISIIRLSLINLDTMQNEHLLCSQESRYRHSFLPCCNVEFHIIVIDFRHWRGWVMWMRLSMIQSKYLFFAAYHGYVRLKFYLSKLS